MRSLFAPAPHRSVDDLAVGLLGAVLAAGNLLLGAFLVLSHPQRFGGSSFAIVVHLAPPRVWGLGFLISGMLALCGQIWMKRHLARVGHTVAATMCVVWVITFCIGAWQVATTSPTGIAAYGIIGALHIVASVVMPRGPSHVP